MDFACSLLHVFCSLVSLKLNYLHHSFRRFPSSHVPGTGGQKRAFRRIEAARTCLKYELRRWTILLSNLGREWSLYLYKANKLGKTAHSNEAGDERCPTNKLRKAVICLQVYKKNTGMSEVYTYVSCEESCVICQQLR